MEGWIGRRGAPYTSQQKEWRVAQPVSHHDWSDRTKLGGLDVGGCFTEHGSAIGVGCMVIQSRKF